MLTNTQEDHITGRAAVSRAATFMFAGILLFFTAWILLLPLFPTQDGPMHRYYVHVLDSLLQHKSTYNVYEIRHPLPPYLTHYGSLLILFHLFSYDMAEKVFACIVLFCLAYGLRLSARQIGPAGQWATLLCAPLFFGWPLMMGFFNFTLGIGLLLLCTAFWQKMPRRGASSLIGFTLLLLVLMLTHPIPLLLLILLTGLDLAISFLLRSRDVEAGAWARMHRLQFIAILFSVCAALFPALAIDSTKTSSTLHLFGFHPEFLRTSLLLSGISPYNSRSLSLWINGYRLALYAIYLGCMLVGLRAFVGAVRRRTPSFGTTLFVATVLLTVALPFLPNMVNGSDYFTSRLIFVLWPGAILAASAGAAPSQKTERGMLAASLACSVLTLLPAQLFLRPVAKELRVAELQPLPPGRPGAVLVSDDESDYVRFKKQLSVDPFKWSAILPFVTANDVALDSPWIDQKITPIEAVPGGPELVADISYSRTLKPPAPNAPSLPTHSLPAWGEAQIVQGADYMVLVATPEEVKRGLAEQLSPEEAAKYSCEPPKNWFVVCLGRKQ